jgi:hypothetical protein
MRNIFAPCAQWQLHPGSGQARWLSGCFDELQDLWTLKARVQGRRRADEVSPSAEPRSHPEPDFRYECLSGTNSIRELGFERERPSGCPCLLLGLCTEPAESRGSEQEGEQRTVWRAATGTAVLSFQAISLGTLGFFARQLGRGEWFRDASWRRERNWERTFSGAAHPSRASPSTLASPFQLGPAS